jgi:CBS domain containing-hemolysin-like protein
MAAVAAALLCVLANGFFVGAEFALAKVRPTALEAKAQAGDAAARRALEITKQMHAYLSATQLGITLASLGLGWLGESAMEELLVQPLLWLGFSPSASAGLAATIGFAILSALHIVIGELVPKALALQRPEQVARYCSWLLRAFFLVSYPALIVLNLASSWTLRMLGHPVTPHAEGKLSLEELHLILRASLGEPDTKKRELLERVLRATDRPVRAIMVPRVDMEVLSLKDGFEAWMAKVRRFGYSRYPVSENGDPDHIIGYVYVKDLLMRSALDAAQQSIASLKRDILIVPESRTVGEVLTEFQRTKIPIALVVDEYGGTAGLVTLEDVVAEIVGDLQDEITSGVTPKVSYQSDGTVLADGSVPVDEVELGGQRLPSVEGADTVGGYMLALLGRLAVPGDVVELPIDGWEAVVEDVRARRVHRVRFRRKPDAERTGPRENVATGR